MDAAIQYILYFAVLVVLAVPLGRFMAHIMDGEHTFLSPVIAPVERGVYRLLRIDAAEQMGCRRYLTPYKSSLQPEGLHPARGMAGSGFRPLSKIPHCCLP